MSKRVMLLVLLALLLGGGLFWLMLEDPGYVLIAFKHYSVEMSLWAMLLLVGLVWFFAKIGKRGVNKAANLSRTLVSRDWFNRKKKSQQRFGNGLLQLMEGRWQQAWKNLEASAERSEMPILNLLGAAIAAFELGEKNEVDRLLILAEKRSANSEAVQLVKARLLIRQQSFKAALDILEKLYRQAPDNALLLGMMMDCYKGDEDWQQIQKILPDLKRLKVVPRENIRELKILVTKNVLRQLAAGSDEGGVSETGYLNYWNELPAVLRKESVVMKAHLQCLYQLGQFAELEKAIPKMLEKHWDEDLVRLYGQLEARDSANQLITAESWLARHPASPQLYLALGRLCRRNKLWGKAMDYLERAAKEDGSPEIYLEHADLAAQLGEQDKSVACFQKGLKLLMSSSPLPEAS